MAFLAPKDLVAIVACKEFAVSLDHLVLKA
jgi:hypothetical protein